MFSYHLETKLVSKTFCRGYILVMKQCWIQHEMQYIRPSITPVPNIAKYKSIMILHRPSIMSSKIWHEFHTISFFTKSRLYIIQKDRLFRSVFVQSTNSIRDVNIGIDYTCWQAQIIENVFLQNSSEEDNNFYMQAKKEDIGSRPCR